MKAEQHFDFDMSVDAIMRTWPSTISVMIRHGMLCVGCPIATFHTVTDACEAHGVDEDTFLGELLAAIRSQEQVTSAAGSPRSASARGGR